MKITLSEVRAIVKSIILESTCKKCGYDNPYMDDDPNYVCRQCMMHDEKFGGKKHAPDEKQVSPYDDELEGDFESSEDIQEWDCSECGATGIYNDHGTCGNCGVQKAGSEADFEFLDRDQVIDRFGEVPVEEWDRDHSDLGYSDQVFRYDNKNGRLSVYPGDQPNVDEPYFWDGAARRWM